MDRRVLAAGQDPDLRLGQAALPKRPQDFSKPRAHVLRILKRQARRQKPQYDVASPDEMPKVEKVQTICIGIDDHDGLFGTSNLLANKPQGDRALIEPLHLLPVSEAFCVATLRACIKSRSSIAGAGQVWMKFDDAIR